VLLFCLLGQKQLVLCVPIQQILIQVPEKINIHAPLDLLPEKVISLALASATLSSN
jgi:hypothetical protein